jgi:hypothetical protein
MNVGSRERAWNSPIGRRGLPIRSRWESRRYIRRVVGKLVGFLSCVPRAGQPQPDAMNPTLVIRSVYWRSQSAGATRVLYHAPAACALAIFSTLPIWAWTRRIRDAAK